MCRWLAYTGTPVLLDTVLYKPVHSLIDQSLHARMGVETTNGDGCGVGWYTPDDGTPAVFRDTGPAWSNRNLREIADHVRSPLFFAHIRASTGTPVQQSNCHPFRHGRWMWMHNGGITDFHQVRRDLALAVDPGLFLDIEGSTDSEMMFYLALTFGLEQDPPGAVARMVGLVERTGHEHGVEFPMQMTVAVTDGRQVWAFRYSSQGASRSLYYSTRVEALRALHPDVEFLQEVSDETRLIVSEPLGDLPGAWNEVPESSYGVVQPGGANLIPFAPQLV
ncbi:class II glutamine amidotransferase [Streptomyces sp. NPDC014991]|uniref:class II glutamine amidotransferase n=1 Tax=Streptomyces sp. NPDC014991 TaxID=3364935 RepID=UPI003700DF1C